MDVDPNHVDRWGAILGGLMIGLSAKYAIMIQDRRRVSKSDLIVDVMLLAANALIVSLVVVRLGLTGQEAVAVAALFGASSDRIVRLVRQRFEREARRHILPDEKEPTVVDVSGNRAEGHMVKAPNPEAAPIEALREVMPLRPFSPEEQAAVDELLAKLRGEK